MTASQGVRPQPFPWPEERPFYGQRVMFWVFGIQEKVGRFVGRTPDDPLPFIANGVLYQGAEVPFWFPIPDNPRDAPEATA